MLDREDFYEMLQVNPTADPEVIQAAYRCLVMKNHPDRNPSPKANDTMQGLNEAYEVLSDPTKRAKYNSMRLASKAASAEPVSEDAPDDEPGFTNPARDADPSFASRVPDEGQSFKNPYMPPDNMGTRPRSEAIGRAAEAKGKEFSYLDWDDDEEEHFRLRIPSWLIVVVGLSAVAALVSELML